MRPHCAAILLGLLIPASVHAQVGKKANTLSTAEYIKAAEAAAPASISANAAVIRLEAGGKVTKLRDGTNGFTCLYGIPGDPSDAPMCGDANALQWLTDAVSGKEKPTNTAPGIAYMAAGGEHHETAAGEIVMQAGPGTKVGKEPPHWMVFWPFDTQVTGLPTKPNEGGVYIMFAGTPYSHLMIYQDPAKIIK